MFKVVSERTFTARLRAQVPVDGGTREEPFKATFRVLGNERVEDFDLESKSGTDEFLRAVIVELHELADAEGHPLAYSDDVRDQIINIPYARTALIRGYFDNISRGRRGN